jgi:hypothetical protein
MKIAYETICNAVKGSTEAMDEILAAYQPYINAITKYKPSDATNTRKLRLDLDAAQVLRKKLIEEIPKWKEICK